MTAAYSPHWSPSYIVIPHPPVSGDRPRALMVGRYFSDESWRPCRLSPDPHILRTWKPITEPAWVANNALQMLGRKSRELAQREFVTSLSRPTNSLVLAQKTLARSGPEAMWTVALTFLAGGATESGYALIDFAIMHAGKDAPELGCSANYLALYGNLETLSYADQNAGPLIQRIKALPLERALRAQLLVAVQIIMGDSIATREALLASGLGLYQWKWPSAGQPDIAMLLPDTATAVTWLSHSFVPIGMEQASLRSKLIRLRELLRSQEITLQSTQTNQVEDPIKLIKLVDQIALAG